MDETRDLRSRTRGKTSGVGVHPRSKEYLFFLRHRGVGKTSGLVGRSDS